MRVEQQLVRVVPDAGGGIPPSVHPQRVPRAGADIGDDTVEHVAGAFGQRDPPLVGPFVEYAEFDQIGRRAVDGDIGAPVTKADTGWIRKRANCGVGHETLSLSAGSGPYRRR